MEKPKCIFCQLQEDKANILAENHSFYLVRDKFPVARGHSLIISKRHFETIFEMTKTEAADLPEIIARTKTILDQEFHPEGYNLGNNNGKAAGQIIFHCHIHVVPRYGEKNESPDLHHTKAYEKLFGEIKAHEREMTLDEREAKKNAHVKTIPTGR